jgi:DNA-binding transcriptional regulator YhcF (GntR family)
MVSLDRDAAVGLRAQLEHQLREGVRSGTLRHGAALPSTRALARELGVARGVVMEAYAQLAAEGYLVSTQGAPTRVAARAATPATAALPDEPPTPRFDFRPGAPDVALFPRTAWATALRQALRDAPDARFSYSDPRGTPELRIALATYLGRARGVAAEPARVMVTSGLTQGLMLTCRALRARGVRRVGVEEPGSADLRGPIATAAWSGCRWPSTAAVSTSTPSSAATSARCSSPRRTSTPPASCSRPSGAPRCSRGPPAATPSCSRTTTTPSTATTASRSGPCRASTRSAWPT